jgi:hypothetical protein
MVQYKVAAFAMKFKVVGVLKICRAAIGTMVKKSSAFCHDYNLPKTVFSCSVTRMKVVRLVNSFNFEAPT